MKQVSGKFTSAKIFTDNVDKTALGQIQELCDQSFAEGSTVRIMPDVHAGKGCTIGTTMTIKDKVVPNLVGVDIGCGIVVCELNVGSKEIDFAELDQVIREKVPSGSDIRETVSDYAPHSLLNELDAIIAGFSKDRALKSLGTLGSGNHYIEVGEGNQGKVFLSIHSGSRSVGSAVAKHHQNKAISYHEFNPNEKADLIARLKAEGRYQDIQIELQNVKPKVINKDLAYLEGSHLDDYLHDMKIAQEFAVANRFVMVQEIVKAMGWAIVDTFDSIHNYIDLDHMILRKGATSAQKGELAVIPLNMRDGSLIVKGKGNADWNYSAPHGAGRVMSRTKARANVDFDDFIKTMEGVFSTSVTRATIDEAPAAYKPKEEIIANIKETVDIVTLVKPLYNFKGVETVPAYMKKKKT
ncbi:RtcB family protein [Aureibacillus halotolerans]|uniref:3'-phosphate/5'-hydroxy nucleic acid ligase n=1 Tax=Aureibacillus halotolerans TaxID=1508390 RepID=A0A4R6UAH1_9BACI|nr:RtcB family protein [Aureibacillus halotolerans]TDQ42872.1 RNA-splicing ligase RtcB [Aureibacillus halotolerans]